MKIVSFIAAALISASTIGVAPAQDAAVRKELVPTGKLRVAIGVSPAPAAFYSIEENGKRRGVTAREPGQGFDLFRRQLNLILRCGARHRNILPEFSRSRLNVALRSTPLQPSKELGRLVLSASVSLKSRIS